MPHLVTDIEIHFRTAGAEPVSLTMDDARGDIQDADPHDPGIWRYRVQLGHGVEDVHIVQMADVRYMRLTGRVEEEPSPTYAGDGVTVSGEIPEPD